MVMKGREQVFHVVSRIVDRRMVMGEAEKEYFYRVMRQQEAFSGCEVLTYAIMGNHFHILVSVPVFPGELSDEEVMKRMRYLYGREKMEAVEEEIERWRRLGQKEREREYFARMRGRMYDLTAFIKDVKQRFTRWYNDEKGRKGNLWEERFKSLLVEGSEGAMSRCAVYIDLNAVRAGIVSVADEYRWCGYGESVAGGKRARQMMGRLFDIGVKKRSWREIEAIYRGLLWGKAVSGAGELKMDLVRKRFRHWTDGFVIGSQEFLERFFSDRKGEDGMRWQFRGAVPLPWEIGEAGLMGATRLRRTPVVGAGDK